MTLDEILEYVEEQADIFLQPQTKAVFKKILDPYFEEVSAFKKKLDVHVLELKKGIAKHLKKNTKNKFLDMYKSPGQDYIKCSNSAVTLDALHFDIYYPIAEHEHIWGWIPRKAYKNDPLPRLLSYAGWVPTEQNLTMLQFATVAILYDAPNIENGCNLIYFGSGDDLADRVASSFMGVIKNDEYTVITPCGRGQHKRVIARLKNAFDTVKIKLDDDSNRTKAGETGQVRMNINFTSEEINAIEYTIKELQWWADEGYQYTWANCEANQQTVDEIIMRVSGITQDEKPPTCRYQISLLNALNEFDIFYERILCENETMAKHIEAKRNRLKEYTRDIPNEDDVPAPWVARGYADDLVQTLQRIVGTSREDSVPKPAETVQMPKDFLFETAQKVNALVKNEAVMKRFQEQVKAFYDDFQEWDEEYFQFSKKTAIRDNESKAAHKKRISKIPEPRQGPDELLKIRNHHTDPNILHLTEHVFSKERQEQGKQKFSSEEKLRSDYVYLTIVYDNALKGARHFNPINTYIKPEDADWAEPVWKRMTEERSGWKPEFLLNELNDALENVNADLDKPPAKIARGGSEVEHQNQDHIPVDDKELTILVELAEGLDKTYSQVEIEAATSIKRGTLKDKLPRLESIGLVHRPLGKRKGYQITEKGKEIAQRNQ